MISENREIAERIRSFVNARIERGAKPDPQRGPNASLIMCAQVIESADYNLRDYVSEHGKLPPEIQSRSGDRYSHKVMDIVMGVDLAEEIRRDASKIGYAPQNKGVFLEREGVRDAW